MSPICENLIPLYDPRAENAVRSFTPSDERNTMYQRIFNSILLCTTLCVATLSLQAQSTDPAQWKVGASGNFNNATVEMLTEWKKAGIDCVEVSGQLFADTKMSKEEKIEWCKNLKAMADKAGLEIWSMHLPFSRKLDISLADDTARQEMIDLCADTIRLAPYLGLKKFVIHPSSEPIKDEDRPARIARSRESLTTLNKVAREQKVQLVVECLPRTCLCNTAEEMLKLLDGLDTDIGICFDSNHLLKEKSEEFVAKVGGRIKSVHISDYDGIDERHWIPGDKRGIIDWVKVVQELAQAGYEGPFLFESAGTPSEKMEA